LTRFKAFWLALEFVGQQNECSLKLRITPIGAHIPTHLRYPSQLLGVPLHHQPTLKRKSLNGRI
jgi:hypothetical protein